MKVTTLTTSVHLSLVPGYSWESINFLSGQLYAEEQEGEKPCAFTTLWQLV